MSEMEIQPSELAARMEAGENLQILDVRAPERLANGRIECCAPARFINVRGSQIVEMDDPAEAGLDRSLPVIAVCGRGHDSMRVARHLADSGFDALSLSGGIMAWMHVLIAREIAPPEGFDRLVQFDRIAKGSLAYLLVARGEAVVIDPPRKFADIEHAAEEFGARIIAVLDTHVHADYISGGTAMADKFAVPYYLHPADNFYPYDGTPGKLNIEPLSDGFTIGIGGQKMETVHAPGHTEGSVCIIAGEAAFTGDFLFIASIGRPDLAGKTEEWSVALLKSIERAIQEWPDTLRIFPAHYATDAERNADKSVWKTLADVKAENRHFKHYDAESFLSWVTSRVSTPPDAYRIIKGINAGLLSASDIEADILEGGKNECALG